MDAMQAAAAQPVPYGTWAEPQRAQLNGIDDGVRLGGDLGQPTVGWIELTSYSPLCRSTPAMATTLPAPDAPVGNGRNGPVTDM
jgi:hypothetical protein